MLVVEYYLDILVEYMEYTVTLSESVNSLASNKKFHKNSAEMFNPPSTLQ